MGKSVGYFVAWSEKQILIEAKGKGIDITDKHFELIKEFREKIKEGGDEYNKFLSDNFSDILRLFRSLGNFYSLSGVICSSG